MASRHAWGGMGRRRPAHEHRERCDQDRDTVQGAGQNGRGSGNAWHESLRVGRGDNPAHGAAKQRQSNAEDPKAQKEPEGQCRPGMADAGCYGSPLIWTRSRRWKRNRPLRGHRLTSRTGHLRGCDAVVTRYMGWAGCPKFLAYSSNTYTLLPA